MKSLALLFIACLVFNAAFALGQIEASPKVIIVPDDYPSITSAIANAEDGDIIYIRNGVYHDSAFVINKTITICGEYARNTIVHLTPPSIIYTHPIFGHTFTSSGNCIAITSNNVKISGLTIRSEGGITATNTDNITIVSNIIDTYSSCHFTGSNLTISRNTISAGSLTMMGHNLTLSKNQLDVYSNGIESNGDYSSIHGNRINGTLYLRTSSSKIVNNIYDKLFIFYGDYNTINYNSGELSLGNSERSCSNNTIKGNLMKGPSVWGIWIGEHCRNNVFSDNYIIDEGYFQFEPTCCSGIVFCNQRGIGYGNTFYHNVFINNSVNIKFYNNNPTGGNFWDNGSQGNYWSNYNGSDDNRDGTGDIPYIINSENADNYPLMTPFTPPEIDVPLPVYYPPLHLDKLDSQLIILNNHSSSQASLESSIAFTEVSAPPVSSPPVDFKFDFNMLHIVLVVALLIVFVSIAVTKSKRNSVSYDHNA